MSPKLKTARRIRESRELLGLNQKQLSDKVGVGQSFICHLEGGRRRPSLTLLAQIAEILHVSLDYLAGLDPKPLVNCKNHKPKTKVKHHGESNRRTQRN